MSATLTQPHSSPAPRDPSPDAWLARILGDRDLDRLKPTIDALEQLVAEHPHHAEALYELANAHAMRGDMQSARLRYEASLSAGVSGERLRRALLRYATVLQLLGETDESAQLVEEVRRRFFGPSAQKVFDAVALHVSGDRDEAFSALLDVLAEAFGSTEEDRIRTAMLRGLTAPR